MSVRTTALADKTRWRGHTACVLSRPLAIALVLVALLSGCGHGESKYGSTTDIAAALGCRHGTSPQVHSNDGYTIETCTFRGHTVSIYTFQKEHSSYSRGVAGDTSHVHGSGWDIWCSRSGDCVKVHQKIGGELIHDTPPTTG
jgi:hypothetical protein